MLCLLLEQKFMTFLERVPGMTREAWGNDLSLTAPPAHVTEFDAMLHAIGIHTRMHAICHAACC